MKSIKKFFGVFLLISFLSTQTSLASIVVHAAEPKAPAFFDPASMSQESAPSPYSSEQERLDVQKLKQHGVHTMDAELLDKIEQAKNNAKNKTNNDPLFKKLEKLKLKAEAEAEELAERRTGLFTEKLQQEKSSLQTVVTAKSKIQILISEKQEGIELTKTDTSLFNNLKSINDAIQQNLDDELNVILTPEERAEIGNIEADYLYSLEDYSSFPKDPEINNQWDIGSILSQFNTHFETPASSTERILVAIIDTGIDYTHEDLVGHFYNPATCFDETGTTTPNGCPFGGWDFVDDDNDPMPANNNETHGTKIAGLIGAQTDSNLGIASLSNNLIDLMPLRVTDGGYIELSKIIDAIYFAVENGVDVINMSFSGPTYSSTLKDAIEYAENNGVIVVAASGNYGLDIDNTPLYPASYNLDNIITVGALNTDHTIASFSNYGDQTVDFAAPGIDLVTTNTGNRYSLVSGTSFSAAIASAMAGALLAQGQDPLSVFSLLDESPTLIQRTISGRVLGAAVDLPPTEPLSIDFYATATDPIYGDYYINSKGGVEVASSTYELSFLTLNPNLAAPVTYSPGNSSSYVLLHGNRFLFGWNPVAGAVNYGLYIRDVTTGVLVFDRDLLTYNTTYTVEGIFIPGHQYRWNMTAFDTNADHGYYSNYRYFEIATAPPVPTIYGPGSTSAPGGAYVSTSQALNWSDVGADYYEVNVLDRDTNTFVIEDYVVNGVSKTVNSLATGHSYKWDVRACYDSPGGCSNYATDRYFVIGTVNTAPTVPAVYGAVSTIEDVVYNLGVVQNWEADGDTVRFNIDWGDSSNNTTSYYSVGTVAVAQHTYTSTGTYCVKVRSYDSEDYSPWSGCKYVDVTVTTSGADLVGIIETNNSSLVAGDSTTIDYTIQNIGDATVTDDFTVDFYLSRDRYITASDIYLGNDTVTSNVTSSGEVSDSKSVNMPAAGYSGYYGDGEYYIGIVVDAQSDVVEASEINNASRGLGLDLRTLQILGTGSGDLTFNVSVGGSPEVGIPFNLTITPSQGGYTGQVNLRALFNNVSPTSVWVDGGTVVPLVLTGGAGITNITVSNSDGTGRSENFYLIDNVFSDEGRAVVRVTDKLGNPLSGSTVRLVCGSQSSTCGYTSGIYTQTTDSGGRAAFSGVTAGKYMVEVEYENFVNDDNQVTIGSGFITNKDLQVVIPADTNLTPIVMIPGILGSTDGNDYLQVPVLRGDYSSRPGDLKIADVPLDSIRGNSLGWSKMISALEKEYGYRNGSTIIECPWDWRYEAEDAAKVFLEKCIDEAKRLTGKDKVDIVAHSMGGLVSRAYIQGDRYRDDVRKVAFMGTPHTGGTDSYLLWGGTVPDALTRTILERQMNSQLFNENKTTSMLYLPDILKSLYLTTERQTVKNFVRGFVPSVGQLLPTYNVLTYNGLDHSLTNYTNSFLKKLNHETTNSTFGEPSSVFGNKTGKVEAKVFYNKKFYTPYKFTVNRSDTRFNEDGEVTVVSSLADGGDGTVLTSSAQWMSSNVSGVSDQEIVENNSDHAHLPRYSIEEVGEFLTGIAFTTSGYELEALFENEPTLTLELTGQHQPLLTTPNGKNVGILANGSTTEEADGIKYFEVNPDFSSITLGSPVGGTYTLTLHRQSEPSEYEFYLDYLSTENQGVYIVNKMYSGATSTITFTLTPTNSDPVQFGKFSSVPRNLAALNSSGSTKLEWNASNSNIPIGYIIYAAGAYDSTLEYVTQVSTTTYTTSDVWAGASTTLMKRYQVSAVYSSGEESFLSNVAYNNDEDQDGLPDHLEVEEGTSTSTPDTDSDGLTDGEEYFNYGTDPTLADTDGDGISDYDEVTPGGTGTTTPSVSAAQIYLDSFENGWAEFGTYNAVTNTQSTTEIAQGTKAISVSTNSTWSGIGMHNLNGLDTTGYDTIKFAYHPGNVTNHITRLKFFDADYQPVFSDYLTVSDYITENISGGLQSKWYNVEIPLEDLGITNTVVYNLLFITSNTATFYLDNLYLSNSTQGGEYDIVVFDNELQNGWGDQSSWSTTADFSSTETTYASSSMAIELQFNTTWAGLGLITPDPVQGSEFTNLHVAYNPGATGGQTDKIILSNENYDTLTPDYISLSDYITGTPQTNTWYSLSIPLVDLGASTSTIKEMIFIGSDPTIIYLDDIRFTDPVVPLDITTSDIYVDGFTSPWNGEYGEWDSIADYNSVGAAYTGSTGIEMEYQNEWAGNTLYSSTTFDVGDFSGFHIAYNPGSTTDHEILIQMEDDTHTQYSDFVSFDNYISGSQQADTWYELNIPLSDLGVSADDLITDITLITSGTSTVYYDDIYFTATSSQSSTTPQTSTNVSIYTDALLPPWSDGGGWLSTTTYNSATHTTGSYGMQTQFTNGSWSETVLVASTPIDTTSLNSLRFAFNLGANASDTVYIKTKDETDSDHGSSVSLNSYISNIAANTWYNLVIPLTDLGIAAGELVKKILFISQDGPTVYFDNMYFGEPNTGGANSFDEGMVTLSFDDGWLSQYTEAFPVLNSASIKGSFNIISEPTINADDVTELVANPSLESDTGGVPDGWQFGTWGTNDATTTYPVSGAEGSDAARVEMTSYTDGDAKWYFNDVPLNENSDYTVSYQYRSNVSNDFVIRYTMQDASYQYDTIKTNPSSTSWASTSAIITAPEDVASITVFPLLTAVGYLEVDDFSVHQNPVYMNPAHVLAIEAAGHEIGSHTQTHQALTTISAGEQDDEIAGSRTDLLSTIGVSNIDILAYPYGDYNTTVQSLVTSSGYIAARSSDLGYNLTNTNKYALKIQSAERYTTLAEMESWIQTAKQDNTWLIILFHQFDDIDSHPYSTSPELFEDLVDYINTDGIDVVTIEEGVELME